jgi:hypothetical protein
MESSLLGKYARHREKRNSSLIHHSSYDGQAGAAGITLEEHSPAFEIEFISNLYKELKKKGVPSYAFPRLVRITEK